MSGMKFNVAQTARNDGLIEESRSETLAGCGDDKFRNRARLSQNCRTGYGYEAPKTLSSTV